MAFLAPLAAFAAELAYFAAIGTVLELLTTSGTQRLDGEGAMFTFRSTAQITPRDSEDAKAIIQMDTNLKIILAMTAAELNKITERKVPEWADIVSVMKQNVLFEEAENDKEHNHYAIHTYKRNSTDFFKFNGEPDDDTVQSIKNWFINDVLDTFDPEMKEVTGVLKDDTFEKLAHIVASTGASVNGLSGIIRRADYEDYTVADIGLIRYPSNENPKARIYRLKINCWRHCNRILAIESNDNGLTIEIDSKEFVPREEVVKEMRKRILSSTDVATLCAKAEAMLMKI
jgi:hypothetical protein